MSDDAPAASSAPAAGRKDGGMRRVLAAEGVSNFGSMLSRLAIPWLAALALQASPAQMALLLVADVLAGALGALLLGAWVDRSGKRAVMLLADGGRALLLLLLALAVWQGWVSFSLLLAAAAAAGALTMAFELARSAWMAQQLAHAELPQRNAQLAMVGSLSETAAFALGGWVYQGLGAMWSLVVDAASYALSALCLRGVREAKWAPTAPPADVQPLKNEDEPTLHSGQGVQSVQDVPHGVFAALRQVWRQAAQGLVMVGQSPLLRALAAIEVLRSVCMALVGTVYTLFVARELALPTGPLGMIAAVGGAGAVLGAWVAPRWGLRWGAGRTMAWGLLAFAVGTACIPMAHGAGWLAITWLVLHQVVGDAGHTLQDVHDRSLRQTAVPADSLARVDAGLRAAGQMALLAGAGLAAALGSAWGHRPVLWLAVGCAAAAAWVAARMVAPVVVQAESPPGPAGPTPQAGQPPCA